jgi:hypothetical protein
MKKLLFTLSLLGGSLCAQAQSEYKINTDRPSQSFSAYAVPKGILTLESGYTLDRIGADNYRSRFQSLPDLSLRYGLTERLELRLGMSYGMTKVWRPQTGSQLINEKGMLPLVLGTKISLWEGEGMKPQVSFLGQLAFPLERSFWIPSPSFRLLFQHDTEKAGSLFYNVGADFNGGGLTWAINLGWEYAFTPEFSAYFELANGITPYTDFLNDEIKYRYNALPNIGFKYAIQNRYQLDLAFGLRSVRANSNLKFGQHQFFTIGFSTFFE